MESNQLDNTPDVNPNSTDRARPLAIFDLDGTLTTSDSFVSYLLTFGRRFSRYRALATMPLWISAYLGNMIKDYADCADFRSISAICISLGKQWLTSPSHQPEHSKSHDNPYAKLSCSPYEQSSDRKGNDFAGKQSWLP